MHKFTELDGIGCASGAKVPPILALDPGETQTGFVLFDGVRVLDFGKIANDNVFHLFTHCTDGLDDHPHLVVEMIASYGMPVGKEIFETCVWIGRFIQAWGDRSQVSRAFRKDIKVHLCGTTKAKDPNVRQALIDRLGQPGTKANPGATYGLSGDMWAALAVAVYAWDTRSLGVK